MLQIKDIHKEYKTGAISPAGAGWREPESAGQ